MRLKSQTYALTTTAHQRRHVFQRDAIAELFIATLFRQRDAGKFKLHAFVVMPNHVHILLTPSLNLTIERCAQLVKGASPTRRASNALERYGKRAITPVA